MIRKTVFDAVGGFDERFHSAGLDDHELWTRIAARYDIADIPEALTYHRTLGGKPACIALEHRALLIATLLERVGADVAKREYLFREHAKYFADFGRELLHSGRSAEGRSYLMQGLRASLTTARSPKTAWRCFSRLMRSYLKTI